MSPLPLYIRRMPAASWRPILCTLVLAMSGCASSRPDNAWSIVRNAEVAGKGDPERNQEFAEELHRQLQGRVSSRLVRFRHEVQGRYGNTFEERSVVLFRSEDHPKNPDWLMDNMMHTPLWLPNGTLERQLTFATRSRNIEVLSISGETSTTEDKVVKPPTEVMKDAGYWSRRFEEVHGGMYDAGSPVDRRKMGQLRGQERR